MKKRQLGFTFIEAIIYVTIVSIMLTSLIPLAWNVIESGTKSSVQEEVSTNSRYVSERIKYEIRNALDINSVTSSQIVLCETSGNCATNPTTITFTSPNMTIQNKGGAVENLNSNDVTVSGVTFTNNSSGDSKTKNISFVFTLQENNSGRSEYKASLTVQSSAEIRSN